jgi:biopolymer transport protein ExbB/TolQ
MLIDKKEILKDFNKLWISNNDINNNMLNIIINDLKNVSNTDQEYIDYWNKYEENNIKNSKLIKKYIFEDISKSIQKIFEKMEKFWNNKNRVVFYYLLIEEKLKVI